MLQCWCSCGFCKDPACLHPLRSWHQPGLYHVAPKNGAMNLYACISWYMIHDDIDWYQLIYVLYIHHRIIYIIYIYNHMQITSCKYLLFVSAFSHLCCSFFVQNGMPNSMTCFFPPGPGVLQRRYASRCNRWTWSRSTSTSEAPLRLQTKSQLRLQHHVGLRWCRSTPPPGCRILTWQWGENCLLIWKKGLLVKMVVNGNPESFSVCFSVGILCRYSIIQSQQTC